MSSWTSRTKWSRCTICVTWWSRWIRRRAVWWLADRISTWIGQWCSAMRVIFTTSSEAHRISSTREGALSDRTTQEAAFWHWARARTTLSFTSIIRRRWQAWRTCWVCRHRCRAWAKIPSSGWSTIRYLTKCPVSLQTLWASSCRVTPHTCSTRLAKTRTSSS